MQCFQCEKLKLECQRAAAVHLNLISQRDAPDAPAGRKILEDFILDASVRARKDAQRALEKHQATHRSVRAAWLFLITLSQGDAWQVSEEFLGAFQ